MIRLSLLFGFCSGVALYTWRDWYKSLCGLILLMAVLEHPDMPKTILGIQGLNIWNILFACILLSWAAHRREEGLSWDMPGHISILLLLYLSVVLAGFFRMMLDARFLAANPPAASVSEYLVNTVKWVVPGLLLFDGCRSRSRFLWALFSILGLYLLLGLQVIRWMPLSELVSGQGLGVRGLKLLKNEIGYHRVNLSMMLAGASWAFFAALPLMSGFKKTMAVAAGFLVILAQAATGGRMGYATWIVVGLSLCLVRWRKYLLFVPVVVLMVALFIPAVANRAMEGISTHASSGEGDYGSDQVTAGRIFVWPLVIEKIKEAPIFGYGRLAMIRTGLTMYTEKVFGDPFSHPHNAYLEVLLDNGLTGMIIILPFYVVILWHGLSLFRDSRNAVFVSIGGVTCSLILALLAASMGSGSFYPREGSVGMWCAIGLLLRTLVERRRIDANSETPLENITDEMLWKSSTSTSSIPAWYAGPGGVS